MNDLVKVENNEIIIANEIVDKFKQFKKLKEEMDLTEKEIKQQLKDAMESVGVKNWAFNGIYAEIKYCDGRTTLDNTRLKEELPDVYKEYSKKGEPYSSFTLKITE